jgi:DNA modification methylase
VTSWRILQGDALERLADLEDGSVQTCVTSPPYFWARDYGVDGQLGHEDTLDEYVFRLVEVFRGVRRVLRDDGTVWLNLGDSYYSGNGQPTGSDPRSPSRNFMRTTVRPLDRAGFGVPKKSLLGVPWRVALALQADGWTLRSDIIWYRPEAFAEPSVRDRPQRQHEHVFLLSNARRYRFDCDALELVGDVWMLPTARIVGHAAAFPAVLPEQCVLASTLPGDTVLDPFCGSGTTGLVALRHGRSFVGVELNPEYVELARRRIVDDAPLLNSVSEAA